MLLRHELPRFEHQRADLVGRELLRLVALGCIDAHELQQPGHLRLKMLDHGSVERGTIAVVLTVHLGKVVGMAQLHEAAMLLARRCIAADEFQRAAGDRLIGTAGENARERLRSQIDHQRQIGIATDSATINLMNHKALRRCISVLFIRLLFAKHGIERFIGGVFHVEALVVGHVGFAGHLNEFGIEYLVLFFQP